MTSQAMRRTEIVSGKMDPWATTSSSKSSQEVCSSFEDNFKPETQQLPDSHQYLATLESKLQKIKNDPDILKQLAEKKEACMQQLLTGEPLEEVFQETPVNYGSLLRNIAPDLIPINQSEIVELLKADHLSTKDV